MLTSRYCKYGSQPPSLHACMHVRMYECVYACVHACMHACMHAFMHACPCTAPITCIRMGSNMNFLFSFGHHSPQVSLKADPRTVYLFTELTDFSRQFGNIIEFMLLAPLLESRGRASRPSARRAKAQRVRRASDE